MVKEEEVVVVDQLMAGDHSPLKVETEIVREDGGGWSNVRITKQINGVAIDWALGAVLLEIVHHLHPQLYINHTQSAVI